MRIDKRGLETLLVFIVLAAAFVYVVRQFMKRRQGENIIVCIGTGIEILALVISMIPVGAYAWPFEIKVRLEEYAELTSLKDLSYISEDRRWYCIYKIDYFFGKEDLSEESYNRLPPRSVEGGFPELDLDKYTYLISYERKVTKLGYFLWDNKGPGIVDFGTANKWGNAVLSDEVYKDKIFIYRFPKVAVDNIHATKYA